MNTNYYFSFKSTLGRLHAVSDGENLLALAFDKNWEAVKEKFPNLTPKKISFFAEVENQIDEYFDKKRKKFDLPIKLQGTEFQQKVWNTLSKIPYGKTLTYSEQAQKMNNPKAIRAIGRTNGLNLISIVIPCHRVIGKDGSLTGYAGGIELKKSLLQLEEG